MDTILIIKFAFRFFMTCLVLYVITYKLLENSLLSHIKEPAFLKLKHISERLVSVMFLCGSAKAIIKMINFIALLFTSTKPKTSDIISLLLLSIILALTVWYRKQFWYYLKTPRKTFFADWYINQYFAMRKDNKFQQAYKYLKKASQYKADSVFIWSMMAILNDAHLENFVLADEYLEKAQDTLDSIPNPSEYDRAVLQAAKGDILLGRNDIKNGLKHLNNAANLDPLNFKPKYERALKWSME